MKVKLAVSATLLIMFLSSCSTPPREQQSKEQSSGSEQEVASKSFAAGGNIDMQLEGGDYVIRAAADNTIRISFGGNTGNANADLGVEGTRATVSVKNTPHSNFHASIEVPRVSNVVIHLGGGNLQMEGIAGDKDISSGAGNVEIAIADPDEYATADGSVKAGDLDASAFGKSGSGLNPSFHWEGHGKYKLQATLGAGNLVVRRK